MADVLQIDPSRLDRRAVDRVATALRGGAVAVLPTDTGYAVVCSVATRDAVRRLHAIRARPDGEGDKQHSVLFSDIAMVTEYARPLSNPVFRLMRRALPGPFTLIVEATKRLSKTALAGRKTLGVRIPDDAICLAVLEALGAPLLATSLISADDEDQASHYDPLDLAAALGDAVDVIVDCGPIYPEPSTVADLTGGGVEILREGKGPVELL